MFATWFMLKKINPKNVIESGICKGQGTWLIENAIPIANIFIKHLILSIQRYVSNRAQNFDEEFANIDWPIISNKHDTILFFDDHQNAFEKIKNIINTVKSIKTSTNTKDSNYLKSFLDSYYEFPLVFEKEKTRWGDNSDNENYPTLEPLFENVEFY